MIRFLPKVELYFWPLHTLFRFVGVSGCRCYLLLGRVKGFLLRLYQSQHAWLLAKFLYAVRWQERSWSGSCESAFNVYLQNKHVIDRNRLNAVLSAPRQTCYPELFSYDQLNRAIHCAIVMQVQGSRMTPSIPGEIWKHSSGASLLVVDSNNRHIAPTSSFARDDNIVGINLQITCFASA